MLLDSNRFEEKLRFAGGHLQQSQVDLLLPIEAESYQAKLLLIAWDKRWNKEPYQEVEREYLYKIALPNSRRTTTPPLQAEHTTEAYRLAWEHSLLRPNYRFSLDYSDRAAEALAKIHNPASLITLVEYFRAASAQPVDADPLNWEIVRPEALVLNTLVAFQDSEAGKAALKTCLALGAEQQARHEAAMQAKGIHKTPQDRYEWSVARHARGLGLPTNFE